jgi:hypothetical protein
VALPPRARGRLDLGQQANSSLISSPLGRTLRRLATIDSVHAVQDHLRSGYAGSRSAHTSSTVQSFLPHIADDEQITQILAVRSHEASSASPLSVG